MDKFEFRKYLYYSLIIVISIITLVFMPMMGSTVGLGFNLPNTDAGWVVYILTRFAVAGLNLLIFYCFMEQAKINVKDNEKYIEANKILELDDPERKYKPQSPREWNRKEYEKKGFMITFGSLLSAFALTNAILTYDWIVFLTYLVTLLLGLIMGVLQMRSAEYYWTNEYWQYAKLVQKTREESKTTDFSDKIEELQKEVENMENKENKIQGEKDDNN